MYTYTCPCCGNQFMAKAPIQIYCSETCAKYHGTEKESLMCSGPYIRKKKK